MLLCQHFRRIASLHTATPDSKLFYTGSLTAPDSDITQPLARAELESNWTTSLHDAVRVGNYPVVEYLVRTGFIVTARDSNNKTASELAFELASPRAKRGYREILDLLSQHPSNSKLKLKLPLGWDEFEIEDGVGFRETSVAHEIHPLTFKKPRVSLLQDRNLAIAEREVKGADNQTYILNPIRFLATTRDASSLRLATETKFNDKWFADEISRTRKPSIGATQDERPWLRYIAISLSFIQRIISQLLGRSYANILLIFVPLCLLGRLKSWEPHTLLAFCVLAMGPLHLNSIQHLDAVCIHRISRASADYLTTLATCIPELWVSIHPNVNRTSTLSNAY